MEPKNSSLVSPDVPLLPSDITSTNLSPMLDSNADDNSHSVNSQYIENMSCVWNSSESFSQPSSSSDEGIQNFEMDDYSK